MEYKLIDTKEQLTQVKLCGRMDVLGVKQVENAFTEHIATPGKPCIIDMENVSFLSSLGLRLILQTLRTLQKSGAFIILVKPQPMICDVIDMAGMTSMIPIAKTVQEAETAIRSST
ncbi:MAG: anti-sigma factor antagonist [Spartobacteria bacterium]|nr:anti-sigma factor antagonist [Spartobacteria bacterium]